MPAPAPALVPAARRPRATLCAAAPGPTRGLALAAAAALAACAPVAPPAPDAAQPPPGVALAEHGARLLAESEMTPRKVASLIAEFMKERKSLSEMRRHLSRYNIKGDPAEMIARDMMSLVVSETAGGKKR